VPHCETHLKDPPLPIHLDDLFLPHLDLGLDLFRLGFELIVPDQPGVRAVGGEEGEVFVSEITGSRIGSRGGQTGKCCIVISLARSSASELHPKSFCRAPNWTYLPSNMLNPILAFLSASCQSSVESPSSGLNGFHLDGSIALLFCSVWEG
jgi:hypothetical protein